VTVDVNEVERFIIVAASQPELPPRVLKQGDTFLLFDRFGDINTHAGGEQGLYRDDTRFVSFLELRLGPERPLLLSSEVALDNEHCTIDLTNGDHLVAGRVVLPKGTLHLRRLRVLWQGVLYERLILTNYGLTPAETVLTLRLDADFVDIFEVRGTVREGRGTSRARVANGSVAHVYTGLDHVRRTLRLTSDPPPDHATITAVQYRLTLSPGEQRMFALQLACETARDARVVPLGFDEAFSTVRARKRVMTSSTRLESSSAPFNNWLNRSAADVEMLLTETAEGAYPFAGVPWFSTVFGRDGIITALELMWVQPEVARGVLCHLAATQSDELDDIRDAQPGKILHEARESEMARTGEVPFHRYYGSVDATPLFVMLAGAYYKRTSDAALVREIWPNVRRALAWIEQYGDIDRDGFVEYARRSPTGLVQQGWKDSHDSIRHADGSYAEGPIALAEVQGYTYAAWLSAATLSLALGEDGETKRYRANAARLAERFEDLFWCEELGTYALALDGQKRPCQVRTSNAGHCLAAGIARRDRGRKVAETLVREDAFSGWGVRTVAAAETFFNPMSYHNGSVWPHDNAIIAAGLAAYRRTDLALAVLQGLFDATTFLELQRLPELFCGFDRRPGEGPTLYPVACSPQAWAAGAVFMLLQSMLGLQLDAPTRTVTFTQPRLPESIAHIHIGGLTVGPGTLDLVCARHAHDVNVTVLRRQGDVQLIVVK
jgi:glycogen debranching enzyme